MIFQPHPNAKEREASASALIKLLLQEAPDFIHEHRYEFLKLALWKVTEAEGIRKHQTQYRSERALATNNKKELRHDHVFQRKIMADDLLLANKEKEKNRIDHILKKAVGCTITHDEHVALNKFKKLDGWDRYKKAGIKVIDTKTGKLFEFPKGGADAF